MKRQPLAVAFWLFMAALVLIRLISLPETDIFFGIYHGQRILAGSPIVAPDTWNFLAAGRNWISNSWLWDVLLALAYGAGGLVAISLLNGLLFALAIALAWSIAMRSHVSGLKRQLVVAAFALSAFTFFTARAVDSDFLVLLVWTWLLLGLRKHGGLKLVLPVLAAAFMLAAIGMNLHLSAPIYGLLLPALAALVLGGSLRTRIGWILAVGVVVTLGVLCTPYGIDGITKASTVADASRHLILEWNPPNLRTQLGWLVTTPALFAIALSLWLGKHRHFWAMLLVYGSVVATFEALRFVTYLIVITFVLACTFAPQLHWRGRRHPKPLTVGNRRLVVGLGASVAAVGALLAVSTYLNPTQLMQVEPKDFAAFAPHSRVLASPAQGSSILFYRRDLQVALDGRNDLIGAAKYSEGNDIFVYDSVPKLRHWLDAYKVDGLFATNAQQQELSERFAQLGWKTHRGVYGVAYTRP